MNKGIFARLPFFVFIFSVYPSLTLLSTNIREVDGSVVVRPLLLSLFGACLLVGTFRLFLRDWTRSSLATTVVLLFFFAYGHIARLLTDRFDPDLNRIIQIALYLLSIALVIFIIRWISQEGIHAGDWTSTINTIALILILIPVLQIAVHVSGITKAVDQPISTPVADEASQSASAAISAPANGNPNQYPDVYLIVLDGYSRADTLRELGFDNSEFLNNLEEMGFYVAECSRTTYKHTLLSMSSTFSMDYLWRAIPNTGVGDKNAAPLYEALIHNPVRNSFEERGYAIVGFQTGYQWDQWADADYYLTMKKESTKDDPSEPIITPFEYIFLRNTAVYPFVEDSALAARRYYNHYQMVNYTLDELPRIAESIPGPKFVYAHIMSPHTPYIFLPDGSLNTDSRYYNTETGTPSNPDLEVEGYINNIKYLNSRMTKILNEIISNSEIPPVIVLQGDHGYVIPERRFNNLMAFHFPNGGNASLYPTITPVNTFRLISNLYFGTSLRLRRDVSLIADVGRPYAKEEVAPFPETCP
ncbi:MAG: sulfatase-like hydrolase/transferase [Chloroflexi bacterium]|nr:sulfatase-like hydrolase/transferase [Chloroflexota bacterium]